MLASGIFLVGCVIQATAYSLVQMLLGRFITGLTVGLLSAAVPLYQSEMAPPELRGALVSIYQLMITLGILVAAYLDMLWVPDDGGWRRAIWVQTVPGALLLLCIYFLPPSPRWLVTQNRATDALKVLQDLRGDAAANDECNGIVRDHQAALAEGEPLWTEMVRVRRIRQLLSLGVAMQLLQQLVGMNAFMYFGPRIFRDLGFSENKFQTINNAVNFVSTFPAVLVADRLGRRFLLMWSAAGMTLACLVMGTLGIVFIVRTGEGGGWTSTSPSAGAIIAGTVFMFVVNFAYGWGPVVWVYTGEIFPLKYRSRCIGVTTMANWVGNWMVAQFTPMLLDVVGFVTFLMYGAFCFLALLLALWLPETKGIELEQIGRVFDMKLGVEEGLRIEFQAPYPLGGEGTCEKESSPDGEGVPLQSREHHPREGMDSGGTAPSLLSAGIRPRMQNQDRSAVPPETYGLKLSGLAPA